MNKKYYRQGDVLIERVRNRQSPEHAQQVRERVLVEGEATGHHHALEVAPEADPADWWKDESAQYVSLPAPAKITHQEHAPIDLPAGTYRITRQREYSPEAIRNVAD